MPSLNPSVRYASLVSVLIVLLAIVSVNMTRNMQKAEAAPAKVTQGFTAELTKIYGDKFAGIQTGDILRFGVRSGGYKNAIAEFVRWDHDHNMQVNIAGELDPNQRILREDLEEIVNDVEIFKNGTPEHERMTKVLKEKQTSMHSSYQDVLAVRAKK